VNAFTRGVRNAFRNLIRTFSIVIILGLSVGLALAMLVGRKAVEQKITDVKSSIGNTISVSPAGARGFAGGGEALTAAQMTQVAAITHVSSVAQTLSDRLATTDTNLVSAIEAGSLGNRQANNSGVGFTAPPPDQVRNGSASTTQRVTRTFTPPVIITGINAVTANTLGTSTLKFTSGTAIDATKDLDVANIGTTLATKNNLTVGSTFTAYGKPVTVSGIYDTGNTFTNAGLVMSLSALQRLSAQPGAVTAATITVDSIDNIDSVTTTIKSALGDKADVVSNQDTAKTALEPLQNVKSISLYSLIGALAAGAIIILLTMVMIVRERRREIGVMKAIGSSNAKTVFQFMSEAVTLTMMGLIVGLGIGAVGANPITKALVTNSASTSTTNQQQAGPGQGGGRALRRFGSNSLTNINAIKTSVGVDTIAYGVLAALAIAVVGSALPALLISKVRPAEVMRAE
jgi:putative ABC transport system permease protein